MRLSFNSLLLTSAILSTNAFAVNHARVNVPFSFSAKGQPYPAGPYDLLIDDNRVSITMESRVDTAKQIRWVAGPAEPAHSPAVVRFDRVGAQYELKNIQLGDKITPDLDKHPKQGISATTSIAGQ